MKQPCEFDAGAGAMELAATQQPPAFIQPTPVGLQLARDLTFREWQAIAESFGRALQTAAWCIGDWLVYGERRWGKQLLLDGEEFDPDTAGRVPSHAFDAAVAATGLDRQTLSNYANVCRKIPIEDRRAEFSFAHHRILAPLPPAKRQEWLALLDSESNKDQLPTVKRLALSVRCVIGAPRVVTDSDLQQRGEHAGHDNYVPHLTRLLTVLRKTLPDMSDDQRAALRDDARPLMQLLRSL